VVWLLRGKKVFTRLTSERSASDLDGFGPWFPCWRSTRWINWICLGLLVRSRLLLAPVPPSILLRTSNVPAVLPTSLLSDLRATDLMESVVRLLVSGRIPPRSASDSEVQVRFIADNNPRSSDIVISNANMCVILLICKTTFSNLKLSNHAQYTP